jgi:arylsulfatase A-like enzyme
MRRRLRWAGACLVGLGLAACARTPGPPTNVVLIDIDTLRADSLGVYGGGPASSPAIDRLAAEGTRFEWAFSQAPYTLPSQVSIVTSLYPWSHGVVRENQRMTTSALTMAEIFQAAGMQTAAFVDGGYVSEHFGFSQGFDSFEDFDRRGVRAMEPAIEAWLRDRDERPFFLFVHTYDPHAPYAPVEPFRSLAVSRVAPPTPGFEPTGEVLEAIRASQWEPPLRRLNDVDLAFARALYGGEVAMVDDWIARLRGVLERSGKLERTVLAIVSDHGEEFQEHGSVLHEKLYTTVTRVPLIIVSPGAPAGVVISNAVESIDLLPTLLELLRLDVPASLQGRSLARAVLLGEEPPARGVLSHSPFWGEQRAIANDERHLIATLSTGAVELYDYRADPLEFVNLADREPSTVRRLVAELSLRVRNLEERQPISDEAVLPAEVEASLRALGYLR